MTERTTTPQTDGISADMLADDLAVETVAAADEQAAFQLAQASDGTTDEEEEAAETAEGSGVAEPAAPAETTIVRIEIDADGAARLPAGTSLAQAQVSGDDLRLVQPDGTVYVIVGAITTVPTLYIGDVQIPAQTLADALAAQGIDIALDGEAAEAPESSGNNFQATHPGISPPFDLTPLLPPTALAFPILQPPQLLEPLRDQNEAPIVGTAALRVSEEGLPGGNPDDIGVIDTTNSVSANAVLPVSDPDGDPLTITLGQPTPALTSNGHDVLWDGVNTNALTGFVDVNDNGVIDAGDVPIIFITIDNLGNISVLLDGQVDHADPTIEDDFDLTVPVFVDDGTDVTTSFFTVTIEDDSPAVIIDADPIIATVLEDGLDATPDGDDVDLSTGNIDSGEDDTDDQADSSIYGSLTTLIAGGADADAVFSIATDLTGANLPTLYSKGDLVTYSVSPDGTTLTAQAGGRTVFTLTVNPDGTWEFDLDDQLDHVNDGANDENFALITAADGSTFVNSIDFSLVITVTDADGDTVSIDFPDAFRIRVQDDVPLANPQGRIAVTVDEDGLAGANTDSGQPGEVDGGGSTTATGLAGALNALVFDGADEDVEFGLSVDNNADGAALVAALGLKSNGFDVDDAVVAGNVITARSSDGRDIFKLTINADGSYEFELLDQVDQPVNSVEDTIAVDLSDFIAAIDFDGDQVALGDAVFLVTIFDDIPAVDITDSDPTTVVEGNTINGTWTSTAGADQPATYKVIVGGVQYDIDTAITVEVGGQTLGTLTVAGDGTWQFVSNPDVDQSGGDPQFSFTVRITDADGDIDEDIHTISVQDGADPTAGTLMLQVEERALDTDVTGDDDSGDLAPGNVTGTDPDLLTETASGNLLFTAGSDDITSFAFADPAVMAPTVVDADGNTVTVSWSLVGGQLIGKIGGVTAIIIAFSAPTSITAGTSDNVVVTITLTDAFPHASPAQPDADLVTISDIKILASDGDDTATGVVTVKIVDDLPDVEVTVDAQADIGAFALNLDETYLPDAPSGEDRYNIGETPQDNDGDLDDVIVVGPTSPDDILGRVATSVTGGLGSLFDITSDAGADGQASLTHQLSFVFTDATPGTGLETTLVNTQTGKTIYLFLEADGTITGRAGDNPAGQVMFIISILNATDPANAQLQFELTRAGAIDHGADDPSIFDEIATLLTADGGDMVELQLTSTLTDNDGDVDVSSASIAIITDSDSLFSIDDDGPAQTVVADDDTAAQVLPVELDETVGADRANAAASEVADGNTDDAGPGIAQVTTAVTDGLIDGLFAADGDYGYDRSGTVTGVLSFVGLPTDGSGVATNLSATNGGAISLYLVSDTLIEGRDTAGDVVFTIAIVTDANGDPQLQTTLFEAIDHGDDGPATSDLFDENIVLTLTAGGPVQLQYEVTRTDGDGDTIVVADQIDLITTQTSFFSFDDDGPVVTAVTATAPQATLDESVGVDPSDPNAADDDTGLASPFGRTTVAAATIAALFSVDYGSDGAAASPNDLQYSLTSSTGGSLDGTATGLFATGNASEIILVDNGGIIEGRAGGAGGDLVFTVTIDALTGAVTIDQYMAIDHGNDGNDFDSTQSLNGVIFVTATAEDGDGDTASATSSVGLDIAFEDDGPQFTSIQNAIVANQPGSITGNMTVDFGSDGFGSFMITDVTDIAGVGLTYNADNTMVTAYFDTNNNGVQDGGELTFYTLTVNDDGTYDFELVNARGGTTLDLDFSGVSGAGPQETYSVPVTGASIEVVFDGLVNGVDLDDPDSPNTTRLDDINAGSAGFGVDNNNLDEGEGFIARFTDTSTSTPFFVNGFSFFLNVINGPMTIEYTATNSITLQTVTAQIVVAADGTVLIDPGFQFDELTVNVLNAIPGNEKGKIDVDSFQVIIPPDDLDLAFDIKATDGDGDSDTLLVSDYDGDGDLDTLNVTLLGDDSSSLPIVGGADDEVILGTSAANTLTGGGGADTFVLNTTASIDTITDYVFGDGDAVDLTALFTADIGGADPNTDELSDFVQVVEAGANDLLQVDVDGGGDSFVTVATLNGDAGVTIIYDDDGTDATGVVV